MGCFAWRRDGDVPHHDALEPLWDTVIRAGRVSSMLPLLEATLTAFGGKPSLAAQDDVDTRKHELQLFGR